MGQQMQPYFEPNEKSKKWRTIMGALGIIHLILAVMLMFISAMKGIYELIDVAILFCALARFDFCCLILYILNITIAFF
jgi:hypothetical protein